MPAGDAQRVWFPEMLEELRSMWSSAMTWEELAGFCGRMTEMRKEIRRTRGIQPPRMRCPKCGQVSRSDISGVSIRSALFAFKNNGVITDSEFKVLDGSWMRHKAKHDLDPHGQGIETPSRVAGSADLCCLGNGPRDACMPFGVIGLRQRTVAVAFRLHLSTRR